MKGVLDTNVVVSGLLTQGGVCAGIIDQLRMGTFQLCVNGRIVAEYAEVIGRTEFSIPAGAVSDFLDWVRHHALRIDAPLSGAVLPDEADLPFLEVTLAAEAILVTGKGAPFSSQGLQGSPSRQSGRIHGVVAPHGVTRKRRSILSLHSLNRPSRLTTAALSPAGGPRGRGRSFRTRSG